MSRHGTRKGILMFMILLICFAAIVFIGTEVFQIENITVAGSAAQDSDVIINLSGISYGDNILKINRQQVKERIEGSPPFAKVQGITIRLPGEVIIAVKARKPAAAVPYLSSYVVVDSGGFIMDIIRQTDHPLLPLVEGIHINKLSKGSLLDKAMNDDYKRKILIRILQALEERGMGSMIQTICLDDPDDITLITKDEIQVILGQAVELDRKLGWLQSEAYTTVLENGGKGTLDVSVPGKAVFLPLPSDEPEDPENGEEQQEEDNRDNEDVVTG